MALSKTLQFGTVTAILFSSVVLSQAQDPCDGIDHRALIFSGGGIKGAFEAGAAYHLIVQRTCDFHDFAGISVGAINAAILAQASPSADRETSHAALALQAEALVNTWESLKGARDIVKPRRFAGLRFAMFGTESFNDFSPLRRLLAANVSTDKLTAGRPLRIGLTCFWDGTYQEVAAVGGDFSVPKARFLDYLYASSVLPVIGRMPRFATRDQEPDSRRVTQFGDGSLRHIIPVASYFVGCGSDSDCTRAKPAHESLQQLFVIATSPYMRGSDLLPVAHANYGRTGTELITDGRKIMRRAIAVLADTPFRTDLDFMLLANQWLAWRAESNPESALRPGTEWVSNASLATAAFPLESYNREEGRTDAHSRPYLIGIVKPKEETADLADLLSFSPQMIRTQLLSGCLAADETMQSEFGLSSMGAACLRRFGNSRVQMAAIVRGE